MKKIVLSLALLFCFTILPVNAKEVEPQVIETEYFLSDDEINHNSMILTETGALSANPDVDVHTTKEQLENGTLTITQVTQLKSRSTYSDGSVVDNYIIMAAGSYSETGYDGAYSVSTLVTVNFDKITIDVSTAYKLTSVSRKSTILDSSFKLGSVNGTMNQTSANGFNSNLQPIFWVDDSKSYFVDTAVSGSTYTTSSGFTNYIIRYAQYHFGANCVTNYIRIRTGNLYSFTFDVSF